MGAIVIDNCYDFGLVGLASYATEPSIEGVSIVYGCHLCAATTSAGGMIRAPFEEEEEEEEEKGPLGHIAELHCDEKKQEK